MTNDGNHMKGNDVKRRQFIKTSAALASVAAITGSTPLGATAADTKVDGALGAGIRAAQQVRAAGNRLAWSLQHS